MARYRYVRSVDELRRETLDVVLLQIPGPPPDGSVPDRLRSWAQDARRILGIYPGVAPVILTEWVASRQGCRIVESLLEAVADHTEEPLEQVAIANACFVYVLGRVMVERKVLSSGRRRSMPALASTPERFPRLAHVQSEFTTVNADRHFSIGLDALIHGLLDSTAPKAARR